MADILAVAFVDGKLGVSLVVVRSKSSPSELLYRKNYLFAGSDRGGDSAARIYSLIGTAKLNGINPESYLRNLLCRIADHLINRIEELLPWNLAEDSRHAT
jgi:hypothetical protein